MKMGGAAGGRVWVWQGHRSSRAAREGNRSKPQVRAGLIQSALSRRNSAGLPPPTSVLTQFRFLRPSPSSVCTSCSEFHVRTTDDFAQTGFLARFQLFEKNEREEAAVLFRCPLPEGGKRGETPGLMLTPHPYRPPPFQG